MDSVNVDLRVMRMDVDGRRRKGRLKRSLDGQCECGLESDEDGCGWEEKERKTEAEPGWTV